MNHQTLAALGLAAAVLAPALHAQDGWTIVRAAAAPAVIESVETLLPPQRDVQAFKLTLANTSGATLEQVTVMTRVLSAAGLRKMFRSEWHTLGGLPGDRATVVLTLKSLAPNDQVVVTLGQVRYGDASRTWDWRLDQIEAHKLMPGTTVTLTGRTILLPAMRLSPEPEAAMCDWCASTAAGICGRKPNAAGTCNRPGCVQSFSCKMDTGCEVTCREDDACC